MKKLFLFAALLVVLFTVPSREAQAFDCDAYCNWGVCGGCYHSCTCDSNGGGTCTCWYGECGLLDGFCKLKPPFQPPITTRALCNLGAWCPNFSAADFSGEQWAVTYKNAILATSDQRFAGFVLTASLASTNKDEEAAINVSAIPAKEEIAHDANFSGVQSVGRNVNGMIFLRGETFPTGKVASIEILHQTVQVPKQAILAYLRAHYTVVPREGKVQPLRFFLVMAAANGKLDGGITTAVAPK